MGFSSDLLESFRSHLMTELEDLLTFSNEHGTAQEMLIVQEFEDKEEKYPQLYIKFGVGSSPGKYTGRPDTHLIQVELFILSVRPSRTQHIVLCEDGNKRSGRELCEYVGSKVATFLNVVYKPNFNVIQTDMDFELDSDYEERDGLHRTTVIYQVQV